MSQTDQDEPVAYLGGQAAAEPEAPVEGYLGGEAPPDSLPALPPAEPQYSASDFIAAPPEAPPQEEPVNYDTYAAEAPPVEAPAEDPNYYAQYGHEEEAPPAVSEDTTSGTATVAEQPVEQSSSFEEPGLPKTISQQDAENIIKRITTKKILPPEVALAEGPRMNPPSELTPRGGAKLGRIVVVVGLMLATGVGLVVFKDEVGPYLPPALAEMIGYKPKVVEKPTEKTDIETREAKLQRELREKVLESEWRAFGYQSLKEFQDSQAPAGATPAGGGAAPGGNGAAPGGSAPGAGGAPGNGAPSSGAGGAATSAGGN